MVLKSSCPDLPIPEVSLANFLTSSILKNGDRVAMVDTTDERSVTFAEVYTQARKCASALNKLGLRKGDFVGVCAPSCVEFPALTMAILYCGATMTTVNPAYTEGEMIQQFSISLPRFVFAGEQAIDTVKKVGMKMKSIQRMFVIGKSDEFATFASLVDSGDDKDFPENVVINPKDDVALLLYSSGTTGMPKSVMLTHYSLITTVIIFGKLYDVNPDMVVYGDRPMFHAGGIYVLLQTLYGGMKLIQEKAFAAERMLRAVETYRVTHAIVVPPMLISLLQAPNAEKYNTSSLKQLDGGGASVAPALMKNVAKKFNVTVFQAYGMTEVGIVSYQNDVRGPVNSVGKIVQNTEAKVIDLLNGKELGPNEQGEILLRGPQNMKGYYKNPEVTSKTIDQDGWIHTGDIGQYDEDGYLYITDRLKEVIKYKTFQVPPAEIESVLLKHPKVADVGVIGIPDEYAGEIPMAFVVRSDQSLTEKDVTDFVEGELTEYKHLRGGVQFTDSIPKSVQGKIQRKELKKMAESYVQSRGRQ